jgi:hypothetical protein
VQESVWVIPATELDLDDIDDLDDVGPAVPADPAGHGDPAGRPPAAPVLVTGSAGRPDEDAS